MGDMHPVEYMDLMAHQLRMKEAAFIDVPVPDGFPTGIADSLESTARWYRRNDTSIPPRKKFPHPASYYEGGEARPRMTPLRTHYYDTYTRERVEIR